MKVKKVWLIAVLFACSLILALGRLFFSQQDKADVNEEKVRKLISDLESESYKEIHKDALKELKGLDEPALKVIAKLLEDKECSVRSAAVNALGELSAKEYAKDVMRLLKDKDYSVRLHAVMTLHTLGAKEYAMDIAKLLEDEDFWVRSSAARALGTLGAKEYAKDIAKLVEDKDWRRVRWLAALALGRLKAKEALSDLKKLLEKEWNYNVRKAIEDAIKKIESEK